MLRFSKYAKNMTLGSSPKGCRWESGQVENISHMTEDEKKKKEVQGNSK
jgi:hypothetical protein